MYEPLETVLDPDRLSVLLARAKSLNPQPGPGGVGMTDYTATMAAFDHLLAQLGLLMDRELTRASVVLLPVSAQIVAHRDPAIPGTRYHIPLVANDGCWSFHGGTWQQLELGRLYRMEPTVEHGAVNWGSTDRLNLMYDLGL